jgi:IS30 family transposase
MAGTPLSATPEVRARWYLQVEKNGMTVREVCKIFGVSRKTYYKWYALDHQLARRSGVRRKMHPHTKLTPRFRVIVVEAKEQYNYGPAKMAAYLKSQYRLIIAPHTIYKFFKRKHLIRKPQKKQAWYTPLKRPYRAVVPGENVQLDVKYVPGPNRTWNYQYRFLDTVTNLQYAYDTEVRDSLTTVSVLKQAQQYFPFQITGIQTDNGGEFRGSFHLHLIAVHITHRYIPKRSAPWNGKVERANRSVDDEYYLNPMRPWKTISQYTRWYNHERPHLGKGMGGRTPQEKYLSLAKTQKCHP